MRPLLVGAMLLLPVAAQAWDGWAWSMTNARGRDLMAMNVNSAVLERIEVLGFGAVSNVWLYRYEHYNVVRYKLWCEDHCNRFVHSDYWGDLSSAFNAGLTVNTGTETQAYVDCNGGAGANVQDWHSIALPNIMWDATNILEACGLPTNYWDYTPWRQLNGIGEAYTNQYTADEDGFSTLDYGWRGLTAVLARLVVTRETNGNGNCYWDNEGTNRWGGFNFGFADTWSEAFDGVSNQWAHSDGAVDNGPYARFAGWYFYSPPATSCYYDAYANRLASKCVVTNQTSDYAFDARVFPIAHVSGVTKMLGGTNTFFDGQGDGPGHVGAWLAYTGSGVTGAMRSAWIGQTNGVIPAAGADPAGSSYVESGSPVPANDADLYDYNGYETVETIVTLDWRDSITYK